MSTKTTITNTKYTSISSDIETGTGHSKDSTDLSLDTCVAIGNKQLEDTAKRILKQVKHRLTYSVKNGILKEGDVARVDNVVDISIVKEIAYGIGFVLTCGYFMCCCGPICDICDGNCNSLVKHRIDCCYDNTLNNNKFIWDYIELHINDGIIEDDKYLWKTEPVSGKYNLNFRFVERAKQNDVRDVKKSGIIWV